MSPLESCPLSVLSVMGVVMMLIMTVYVYEIIEVFVLRRQMRLLVPLVALLGTTLYLCRACAILINAEEHPNLPLFEAVLSMPLWAVGLLLVADATVALVLVVWLRGWSRRRITADSIKEALDTLPDGVCFSREDGRPLLVNAQMNALAHRIFGTAVLDERQLWDRLDARDCLPGVTVSYGDAAGGYLVEFSDGRAWEFRRRVIEEPRAKAAAPSAGIVETIATDVTDELVLTHEFERKNERLAAVGERLRTYGADIVRLTREEEILAAKTLVHDEVGSALVALRAYERQEPSKRDREALLATWKRTAGLMEVAMQSDVGADAWELFERAAQAVDVELVVKGDLPPAGKTRDLLVRVVHECLNNAVRHAGAHCLWVELRREDGELVVRVTNDGAVPESPHDETGGLANLRTAIERANGTMLVEWTPSFALTARLTEEM